MNTEIKYRAWLKSVGEMVEVLEIDLYNKEVAYIWTEQTFDYVLEQTREVDKIDDLVLMQYTGLKDKNGVEIYEGDIVEAPSSKAKYLVDYVEGCFVGRIKYREYTNLYKALKVIGNIHETPSILEVLP